MKKKILIMGIETSCDETAVSIIQDNGKKSPKIEIWHKWSIFCGVFTLQSGYFTGTAPYYDLLMLF